MVTPINTELERARRLCRYTDEDCAGPLWRVDWRDGVEWRLCQHHVDYHADALDDSHARVEPLDALLEDLL
jgi:hypothetical protein